MPGSFAHMEYRNEFAPELVYVDTPAGDIFLVADDDVVSGLPAVTARGAWVRADDLGTPPE
jgi:hypothetical protein